MRYSIFFKFVLLIILNLQNDPADSQNCSYLRFGSDTIAIDTIITSYNSEKLARATLKGADDFIINIPGPSTVLAQENDHGDLIIIKDMPGDEDTLEINFNLGNASIDSLGFLDSFDMELVVDCERHHTNDIQLFLIGKRTEKFEIHNSNDLWHVLNMKHIYKPELIILRGLTFWNYKGQRGKIVSTFMWNID